MVAATEEPLPVHSSETAAARYKDLMIALQNPDLLYVMGQMIKTILTAPMTIENAALANDADLYAREQLIGEIRGLRRFFVESEELLSNFRQMASGLPLGGP